MIGRNGKPSPAVTVLVLFTVLMPQPTHIKNVEPKKGLETSPLTTVEVVEGGRIVLPCHVSPPISSDDTILVLFYRGSIGTPIYSVDGRDGPVRQGQHWADRRVLGDRASLELLGGEAAGLVVSPVRDSDHDQYRCRVDYRSHPTRNIRVQLNVIVPPRFVRVVSEAGLEASGVIGPYTLGSSLTLHCHASKGRPLPQVSWWSGTRLLDDVSEDRRGDLTTNTLTLPSLTRADLYRALTCQAVNSNLSAPTAVYLKLDMIFPPVNVRILPPGMTLEEGRQYRVVCQTSGSRPKADITWWKDGMLMTDAKSQVFHEGNMTRSTLKLTPTLADHETYISCRAQNPLLKAQVIEDALKLEVHYKPRLSLAAGQSLDMKDIKEGDDVYFECGIKANPKVYKVQWFHDGDELNHNVSSGVIKSNQSLVLQKVGRQSTGQYSCTAANLQGSAHSGQLMLSVKYAPSCVYGQKVVYGAGKHEQLNVSCSVEAFPLPDAFRWAFNSSSEVIELPRTQMVRLEATVSQVSYTPRSHLDYGSLLCWATNTVSTQHHPCVFHIIHAAPPDPVNNCTVENISSSGGDVKCHGGWDGGLTQTFTLSVSHRRVHQSKKVPRVLANTATAPRPVFSLAGLRAGSQYILTITAVNKKGQSDPVMLSIVTLKDVAEKQTSPGTEVVSIMPVVGLAAGLVMTLVVLCVVIVVVVVIRARQVYTPPPREVKMRFGKESSSPLEVRLEENLSDTDDNNPDLIPVNYDHQLLKTGQTEFSEDERDHLKNHDIRHQLKQQDLPHSDSQADNQNLQEMHSQGPNLKEFFDHQHGEETTDTEDIYNSPQHLLRQRSWVSARDADPQLLLGRSLMTSSASPHTSHTRSSSLDPHSMSSTPTSPSYLGDGPFHSRVGCPPDVSLTSTLPRHQPLQSLSYKRQFSVSNLSTSRDLDSSQSYSRGLRSRSKANHRLSLGKNDLTFLDRVGLSLASRGRSGSLSALNTSLEREDTVRTLNTRHSVFENFSRQRESDV